MSPRRVFLVSLPITLAMILAGMPADACIVISPVKLTDVKYADSVVIGKISKFKIIRDQKFRDRMLATPGLSKEERDLYRDGSTLMSDYATFDLNVDEVLAGTASAKVRIKWRNESFGIPDRMKPGPYLVALAYLGSKKRTGFWGFSSDSIAMLQGPCSSPFLFETGSKDAKIVAGILAKSNAASGKKK